MKVNKRSIGAFGAIAAVSALALAGCASGGDANTGDDTESAGEITVWVDADRASVLEDAAADFTEDTGVDVKLVQKEFGEIRDQFVQQVPTGEGPDIAVGAHDWLGVLVTNGVVAPVELGDGAADYERSPSTPGATRVRSTACRTPSRTSACCATPTSPPRHPRRTTT